MIENKIISYFTGACNLHGGTDVQRGLGRKS